MKSPFTILSFLLATILFSIPIAGTEERKEGKNTDEEDKQLKEYTWDEIRKHNTEEDLWVVLYNRVYDVTEFQLDHSGGPDVLQDIAAQDATEEFENLLHTEKARKMAKKYLIGKVKGEDLGNLFPDNDDKVNKNPWERINEYLRKNRIVRFILIFILIAVVAKGLELLFKPSKEKRKKKLSKKGKKNSSSS